MRTSGPNQIGQKEHAALQEFIRPVTNPLVLILLFASVVSMVTGDYADASIIFIIVIIRRKQAGHGEQTALKENGNLMCRCQNPPRWTRVWLYSKSGNTAQVEVMWDDGAT